MRYTRLGLVVLLVLAGAYAYALSRGAAPHPGAPVAGDLGRLPLVFEPNAGQADAAARFVAHAPGGALAFAADGVTLALDAAAPAAGGERGPGVAAPPAQRLAALRFVGAAPGAQLQGEAPLPGRVSYLRGADAAHWQTDLPTYGGLVYSGLYTGVDLRYGGAAGRLKGTYTVAPGADPGQIRWRYDGVESTSVDAAGALVARLAGADGAGATVTEDAPVAWQAVDGRRVSVAAAYRLAADGSVGFALGAYDASLPLIIDPVVNYATYLGGASRDLARAIAVDATGAVYVTGVTNSLDFPVQGPFQPNYHGTDDVFVAKINPSGTALVYATYLGGDNYETASGIAVDAGGHVFIAGETGSPDFPTTAGAYQRTYGGPGGDIFVTRLNTTGSAPLYSTFIGGNDVEGANALAIDSTGAAYVGGFSASHNYPITPGAFQPVIHDDLGADAVVTKLNATGSALVYSTWLGGADEDAVYGIAVDGAGSAYVAGWTQAVDFPTRLAAQATCGCASGGDGRTLGDGFVARFNATGTDLIFSTFLGGSLADRATGLALDRTGAVYVTGWTISSDFPTVGAYQGARPGATSAFLTKLPASGGRLVYSTYYGGSESEVPAGVAVNAAGEAYVVGEAESGDLPQVAAVQTGYSGEHDAFIVRFNATGTAPVFASYLGGSAQDAAAAIALDRVGIAYVAGMTRSDDFPLVRPLQPASHGGADAFVAKIAPGGVAPTPTGAPRPPEPTPRPSPVCAITFNDVPADSAYAPAICCLVSTDVISGYDCGGPGEPCPGRYFRPDAPVTRGQLARFIANSASFYYHPTPTPDHQTFADIPPGAPFWAAVELLAAQTAGPISGYTCGGPGEPCDAQRRPYYRPNVNVTRAQLSKIVARSAGYYAGTGMQIFEDVPGSNPFYAWIGALNDHGAISGYSCGSAPDAPCVAPGNRPYFRPGLPVTRGQVAKIFTQVFPQVCAPRP
jgi:hypothetical protein